MKIGLCILCLIAVITASGCGDNAVRKTSFVQSDSDAEWSMIGFGRERAIKFNSLGYLTLGANGKVIGGNAQEFGVDKKKFIGGEILISAQGSLSGVIDTYLADTDTKEQYVILDGRMTPEKDISVFTGRFPTDRRGIVVLISKNKAFAQADLAGAWALLHDRIYSVNIDKEGTITDCLLASDDKAGERICEGKFTLDPRGAVSASMFFSDSKRAPVTVGGQLNSGKNFMALVGSDSTHFEGTTMTFMRRDGAFSIDDMEGLWRVSMTGYSGTLFGMLRMDKAGNVLEGTWSRIGYIPNTNDAGELLDGKLSLTDEGEISGFFKTSDGFTCEIIGGQMSPKKDIVDALYPDGPGTQGKMLFIRVP